MSSTKHKIETILKIHHASSKKNTKERTNERSSRLSEEERKPTDSFPVAIVVADLFFESANQNPK